MTHRVRVTCLGTAMFPFVDPEDESRLDYEDSMPRRRLVTELVIDGGETLATIIDRAALDFGLTIDPAIGDLDVDWTGDPTQVARHLSSVGLGDGTPEGFVATSNVCIRDELGRVIWWVDFREVTYDQLVDSVEVGFSDGDPSDLIIEPYPPAGGDFFVGDITTFLVIAETLVLALIQLKDAADTADWIKQGFTLARARLRGGAKSVGTHATELEGRNGSAARISQLLLIPRTSGQFAELLGMTVMQVEALLYGWGYEPGLDGRWRVGESSAAVLVRTVVRIAEANPLDLVGQTPDYVGLDDTDEERRLLLRMALADADTPADVRIPDSQSFIGYPPP